jgi:hypothetical protein
MCPSLLHLDFIITVGIHLILLPPPRGHFFLLFFFTIKIKLRNLAANYKSLIFFCVNQDIPGFVQTNPRPGWQGLPKRPAADEERGRTPDLVSDESAPNRSARTSCFYLHLGVTFFFFFFLP